MATITDTPHKMHDPAHPGEILRALYLEPLGLAITVAAEALGVTRKHVSSIVNGRAPISPEMALRLAQAFATEPEFWLNLQAQYDLWRVRENPDRPKVRRLVKKAA
jgi:antitoxin HigA-1